MKCHEFKQFQQLPLNYVGKSHEKTYLVECPQLEFPRHSINDAIHERGWQEFQYLFPLDPTFRKALLHKCVHVELDLDSMFYLYFLG